LASSFFAPGVPQILEEFHTSSQELATFVVSVYVLGFGVGPLLIAPLSEMYGRMPLYMICNITFVVFAVACAVSNSMGMLIAFRLLQGIVGSAPLCIGGGTIADIIPPQNRGGAMAVWALGPLFGPVVGPVAGGFLVDAEGWRWVYWVIVITGGATAAACIFLVRETYAPVILEKKAARLRKETGNPDLRSKLDSGISHKERLLRSCVRPTKMLIFSPIVSSLSLYMSVAYGKCCCLYSSRWLSPD
jgi:multidrug resistance protein